MDFSDMSVDSRSDVSYPEGLDDSHYLEGSDVDDRYLDDDVVVATRREAPWEVITPDNMHQHLSDKLEEVSDVLACTTSVARILLTEYCWDKTRLINDYVEKGREVVFRRTGCPVVEDPVLPPQEEVLCECCYDRVARSDGTFMSCGHWFCNDCWVGYLEVKIRDGQSCLVECMAYKCGNRCDEHMVLKLLTEQPEIRARYQRTLLESYVNDNGHVKWCPSVPNCGNALRNNRDECCEPVCSCGLQFCFSCLGEAHSPCTCEMWGGWEIKRKDDSETMHWITANTKKCPKCGKVVEKNGGCNLMTCRCGQHFCWLCGGATGSAHTYERIENHSCGRYKEEANRSIDAAASQHKRYMHYFTRWNGHRDSLTREIEKSDAMKENLTKMVDMLPSPVVEHNALDAVVRVLLSARRVLSNSYVFAYFLCGKDWYLDEVHPEQISLNQPLFEDMQQQLETEVERLSKYLSNSEPESEIVEQPHFGDVLNCARTVLRRMQNFYDAINSGLLGHLEQSVVSISDFLPHGLQI